VAKLMLMLMLMLMLVLVLVLVPVFRILVVTLDRSSLFISQKHSVRTDRKRYYGIV
jgi:hypothetical protein